MVFLKNSRCNLGNLDLSWVLLCSILSFYCKAMTAMTVMTIMLNCNKSVNPPGAQTVLYLPVPPVAQTVL